MTYRALSDPFRAAVIISVAVMPSLSDSLAFHNASNFSRIAGMVDPLIAGVHVRKASRVGRALHVVLSPERIHARAFLAQVPRQ